MRDVSTFRLYLLRAAYLLIGVGLSIMIWPLLLQKSAHVDHMRGVVWCVLTAVSLLALVGIRYPLRMLPLLLFELLWKTIWLLAIGLPRWSAGRLDAPNQGTWFDCLFGVALCLVVIPWGYVLKHYVRQPGDPWGRQPASVGRTANAGEVQPNAAA